MDIILAILLGMGIGVLASLVIYIGKMTVRTFIKRIKEKHGKKITIKRAKKLLAEILNNKEENKNQEEAIKISELEKLFGKEGCVEYTRNEEGKVNPEDIQILQAEEMDSELKSLFDQHGGELVLTT